MNKPHVFVLTVENGYTYEDFRKWNAGVFASLKSAVKAGKDVLTYQIEEWRGNQYIACYDSKGDRE